MEKPFGKFDQGFYYTACKLVDEITKRNHLHFLTEIDATGMDLFRQNQKEKKLIPSSYTSFVVKAASLALQKHPHLNCMILERPFSSRIIRLETITATIAVERMVDEVDMVFAPMIRSTNKLPLAEITRQMQYFAEVEPKEFQPYKQFIAITKLAKYLPSVVGRIFAVPGYSKSLWEKFRGGSFAVTSPGKYGGCDQVLPPWPWPLTFSFGHVKFRPFAVGKTVEARKTMRLTITADRRLANGAPLARFAECVKQFLEIPDRMSDCREEKESVLPSPIDPEGRHRFKELASTAINSNQ